MAIALRRMPLASLIAFCLLLLPVSARAQPPGPDAFAQEHEAAAKRNDTSPEFTMAFADDRRAFRPGEAILLNFTFGRVSVNAHDYAHYPNLHPSDVHFDHTDGTAEPTSDLDNSGIYMSGGVYGGVYGCSTSGCKPITLPVYLNQAVRFDAPGHYRFYVTSTRFFPESRCDTPVVSNMLELEILPRDLAWEARTAATAFETIHTSPDDEARHSAARALNYLSTNAAVDAMIERYLDRRPDDAVRPFAVSTFFSARDRRYAIDRLAGLLDDPALNVSSDLPRVLAALSLGSETRVHRFPDSVFMTALRAFSRRRALALRTAGTLGTTLDSELAAFSKEDLAALTISAAFADFPRDVERACWRLTPSVRRRVLLNMRRTFADPVFVPFLERIVRTDVGKKGAADVAAWLLRDVAPDRLRADILTDLKTPRPRIPVAAARVIADQELPELDALFVRQLRTAATNAEFASALGTIERFATDAIASDVERAYRRRAASSRCAIVIPALAYFFRVDPSFAREELQAAWKTLLERDKGCGDFRTSGILPSIAGYRASPALEQAALSALEGTDAALAADAATMLKEHGSEEAQAALWNAFERWYARWKDRVPELRQLRARDSFPWEASLDDAFRDALSDAVGWRIDERGFDRMTALCLMASCAERVTYDRQEPRRGRIYFGGLDAATGEPYFSVDLNHLHSLASLERKITQYTTATAFSWSASGINPWSDRVENARYFDRVTAIVRRHGMSIEPARYSVDCTKLTTK